jgi:hypothetical protein
VLGREHHAGVPPRLLDAGRAVDLLDLPRARQDVGLVVGVEQDGDHGPVALLDGRRVELVELLPQHVLDERQHHVGVLAARPTRAQVLGELDRLPEGQPPHPLPAVGLVVVVPQRARDPRPVLGLGVAAERLVVGRVVDLRGRRGRPALQHPADGGVARRALEREDRRGGRRRRGLVSPVALGRFGAAGGLAASHAAECLSLP